jgi:hypothetical protein
MDGTNTETQTVTCCSTPGCTSPSNEDRLEVVAERGDSAVDKACVDKRLQRSGRRIGVERRRRGERAERGRGRVRAQLETGRKAQQRQPDGSLATKAIALR